MVHGQVKPLCPGRFILQYMQSHQESQQLHDNVLCQGSVEGQDQHGQTEHHVQCKAQIEHRHDLIQVTVQQPSSKYSQKTSHNDQHGLVRNGHNHQHHGCHGHRYHILPHIIDLGRLPSPCRGRDTAKEKANGRIHEAGPPLCLYLQRSKKIMEDGRLSPYEEYHTGHAQDQEHRRCLGHGIRYIA